MLFKKKKKKKKRMTRVTLLTQFKIEFLLPFTGCRKCLEKCLSMYLIYRNTIIQNICFHEAIKSNVLFKKLKENKRKGKKKEGCVKFIAEMTNGRVICGHRCPH